MQFKTGTVTGIANFFDLLVRFLAGYGSGTTPIFTGTGNGVMQYIGAMPTTVTENWTLTATSATTFSVVGSVSGAQATLTVGDYYFNDYLEILILAGGIPFAVSDQFTFSTTAGLMGASERWEVLRYQGVDTIDSSSFLVNFEPWKAVKGPYHNHDNGWKTALGDHVNSWISLRFAQPIDIVTLRLSGPVPEPGTYPDYTQGVTSFKLQWSNDGVTWVDRQQWSGLTWAHTGTTNSPPIVPTPQDFVLTGTSPGPKRHWRIYILSNNGNVNYSQISKIQAVTFEVFTDYNWCTRPIACLKAPGMTGLDPCYINFQLYDRPTNDVYNIGVTGANGFTNQNTFDNHPGALTAMGIPLSDSSITYWISANGQRVVIGAKVGLVTISTYAGKMLTFGLPTQYPYPLVIAAPLSTASQTKYTDASVTMPFKGNRANMKLRQIDGVWIQPLAWPYSSGLTFRDVDGDYPLLPITLYDGSDTYGVLDGVHHISGFDNASENTVTVGAETHVVLQDATRSGIGDMHSMRIA